MGERGRGCPGTRSRAEALPGQHRQEEIRELVKSGFLGGKCQGRICTPRICCPQKAGSDILGGDAHVMVFLHWTSRFPVKESEMS